MLKKTFGIAVLLTALLAADLPGRAASTAGPRVYPGDLKETAQIGNDLYDSLDAKYQKMFQAPPICLLASAAPEMALAEKIEGCKASCQLCVSAGFVNLINHIAHAKAIDRIKPGYFDHYMSGLAGATVDGKEPAAPDIAEDCYWTDDVINDQSSFFNQMMGMTLAINLSHCYLGQFNKYSGQMRSGKLMCINDVLTSNEWEQGVRAGAVNSLNCALGTEGAKALFEAVGKMARRPAWAAYILPSKIDARKLNQQLGKYEVAFFRGGLK